MTIFDLMFIVCFLAAGVALVRAAYLACRGRWAKSARVLRRLGYGTAVYAAVLVTVSLTSRAKVLVMGEKQCFDENGLVSSVDDAAGCVHQVGQPPVVADSDGIFCIVTVRVSNAGRRRAQRETDVAVCLIDNGGHRLSLVAAWTTGRLMRRGCRHGQDLRTKMPPGGSV